MKRVRRRNKVEKDKTAPTLITAPTITTPISSRVQRVEQGWIRHILQWRRFQASALQKHEVNTSSIEMEWRIGYLTDDEKWCSSLSKEMFDRWLELFQKKVSLSSSSQTHRYIDYIDNKHQRFRLCTDGTYHIIQKKRMIALPYIFMRDNNNNEQSQSQFGLRMCLTKEEKQLQEMFNDHAESFTSIRIATRQCYFPTQLPHVVIDATQVYQPYTDETTYHIEIEVLSHPFHLQEDVYIAKTIWQWMDQWVVDRVFYDISPLTPPTPLLCIGKGSA